MIFGSANAPQRAGSMVFNNTSLPSGITEIVSAVANTTGIIVRTCCLLSGSGGLNLQSSGGAIFMLSPPVGNIFYNGPGMLFPAGEAVRLSSGAAGNQAFVSYDVGP
jgi:hypothetical protein